MSFAAWFACVLMAVVIVYQFALVRALGQRDVARRREQTLSDQLAEARADYGAEIERSKRMARIAIEADRFFLDPSQGYDDAIRIIGSAADVMAIPTAHPERLAS